MIPSPSFTNIRNFAVNEFHSLRLRALRDSFIAKLLRKNNSLKTFADHHSASVQTKRFTGTQNIRVDKIIGSMGRDVDFDIKFRPLKKHLCDRWVNALLLRETDGWQPIIVHKVGEFYYLEDGHHRVSVAHSSGMLFIEAEVWDHSEYRAPRDSCTSRRTPARRPSEAYSTNS